MKHDDLPDRWKTKLAEWIRRCTDDRRERLGASDFACTHSVSLTFEDGSTAMFKYAILIEAPEFNEIGVFTEHCGYHIFPLGGTHAARVET